MQLLLVSLYVEVHYDSILCTVLSLKPQPCIYYFYGYVVGLRICSFFLKNKLLSLAATIISNNNHFNLTQKSTYIATFYILISETFTEYILL